MSDHGQLKLSGSRVSGGLILDADQTEVTSPEQCDYLLVFCPVASRVGTDISEALDLIPGKEFLWSVFAGKQAVLVVMHHTFNHHHVIAASSRLVQNPNILLTVDCLFHDNKLLNCDLNVKMWHEVYNFLGVSQVKTRFTENRSLCSTSEMMHTLQSLTNH
uniref:Uncharacterized protein n=1 Tax=Amphiprion percula TaxID=161767 RepID=A0A3P8T3E6_AMPPE